MPQPLAGIRVIELANFIAGPLAGTLLADMGADVIKIESPKGDMGRAMPPQRENESVSFVALNRNKRSLVLDLKQPAAREILLKLAATCDVLLEAYFEADWSSVHPEYRGTFRTLRAKMTHREEDPLIVPTRDGWKMISAYETLQRIIRKAWAANEQRLKLPPLPRDVLGWDEDDEEWRQYDLL